MKLTNALIKETLLKLRYKDKKEICLNRKLSPPKNCKGDDLDDFIAMRIDSTKTIKEVFNSLSLEDSFALYMLGKCKKGIGLDDFSGMMGYSKYSFGEKYLKIIFDSLRDKFINKGVLFVKSNSNLWRKKFERYEIIFPEEFANLLIPQIPKENMKKMKFDFENFKRNIKDTINYDLLEIGDKLKSNPLTFKIKDASLCLNSSEIKSISAVRNKLLSIWTQGKIRRTTGGFGENTYTLRKAILNLIPDGKAIDIDYLFDLFKTFDIEPNEDDKDDFIQYGIDLNIITTDKKKKFLTLFPKVSEDCIYTQEKFNETESKIYVELGKDVNLQGLLSLSKIGEVGIDKKHLTITPTLIEIAKINKDDEFFKEILNRSELVKDIVDTIVKRENKVKVHSNLVIIKLNSLDIEGTLKALHEDELFELGDGYYAVAKNKIDIITKTAKRKGFIPKILEEAR